MTNKLGATKVRAKGWHFAFERLKLEVDMLIYMTPTSELRNKITELNIAVMELEKFAKEQKEVL
jgi:hypothetical protein